MILTRLSDFTATEKYYSNGELHLVKCIDGVYWWSVERWSVDLMQYEVTNECARFTLVMALSKVREYRSYTKSIVSVRCALPTRGWSRRWSSSSSRTCRTLTHWLSSLYTIRRCTDVGDVLLIVLPSLVKCMYLRADGCLYRGNEFIYLTEGHQSMGDHCALKQF